MTQWCIPNSTSEGNRDRACNRSVSQRLHSRWLRGIRPMSSSDSNFSPFISCKNIIHDWSSTVLLYVKCSISRLDRNPALERDARAAMSWPVRLQLHSFSTRRRVSFCNIWRSSPRFPPRLLFQDKFKVSSSVKCGRVSANSTMDSLVRLQLLTLRFLNFGKKRIRAIKCFTVCPMFLFRLNSALADSSVRELFVSEQKHHLQSTNTRGYQTLGVE